MSTIQVYAQLEHRDGSDVQRHSSAVKQFCMFHGRTSLLRAVRYLAWERLDVSTERQAVKRVIHRDAQAN